MAVHMTPEDWAAMGYEYTALGLTELLHPALCLTMRVVVDGVPVSSKTVSPEPGVKDLAWADSELTIGAEGAERVLVIKVDLDPPLPLPRLPYEYAAWLA